MKALLREIDSMSEREAEDVLAYHRWNDGPTICPKCGATGAYRVETRRKYECNECRHQFTVTSGTPLASHKLTFKQCLKVIILADEIEPSDKRIMEIVGVTPAAAPRLARTIARVRENSDMFWWKPDFPKAARK